MSNHLVRFPDVEFEVITYLRAQLAVIDDPAVVVNLIPDPRPSRIVHVIRTGGAREDIVRDGAQITVDCWDDRQDNAHDLAQMVRGLMGVMPYRHAGATSYRVQEAGFAPLPHPDTEQYRFTTTLRIDFRCLA